MRKAAAVLGVLVALVLIVVVAAWALVDVNSYRTTIQSQLERQLARPVTLGKIGLQIFPLHFEVENIAITEDNSFGSQTPFVRADKLSVYVSLASLLRGNVKIDSVNLDRPTVELIKNKQGSWNFASLGKPENPAPASNSAGGASPQFTLSKLAITDGQVAITDLQTARPRVVYDHIDIGLLDYTTGSPFSFEVGLHFSGKGSQQLHLKGKGGPIHDDNPAATPFEGTLVVREVGINALKTFLDTESLAKTDGALSGESQIRNDSGKISAKGNMLLQNARMNGLDIGYPIALDYDLTTDTEAGLVNIANATMKLGNTPFNLTGTLKTDVDPLQLNLHLKSGDVSIAEVARLASAFGVVFAPGTDVSGHFNGDVQVRGSAANPSLNGTVSARELKVSGKEIPQPVEINSVTLALTPAEIRSNEFEVRSGKTTVASSFALKQYSSKSPAVDMNLRAPGATLQEIQAIAKAYGVKSLDSVTGTGLLNLDIHAAGPLQTVGSADVVKLLNGNVNLNFDTLRLTGTDMTRELATIAGFTKSSDPDKPGTDVMRLVGHIVVKDGIAETNDLQALFDAGSLSAKGTSDLAANALNLNLTAVFSKAFSDKIGSTRAGSYLNTALANDKGELVIPTIVTGNLQKLKFAPDMKAVAKLQRDKFLPGADNPKAAVSNLLKAATEKKEGDADQTPQKPKDAIKGILGGLLKKKP